MEISLDDWFKRQDNAVSFNRAEIENQYRWLDSAITLLTEVQLFVSDGPVVAAIRRKMQADDATRYLATTLTVNLLNDALGSLISGTRLLLFGDLTDAFALVRCAFEGSAYAEYFVYHPDKAQSYMELETLLSTDTTNVVLGVNLGPELQRRGLQISTIINEMATRGGDPKVLYARLCNLGTHASPKRVGLTLSPPVKGSIVLSAVSRSTEAFSRRNWNVMCAIDMMSVAKYAVEMLFECYPDWFVGNPGLVERYKSLGEEFMGAQAVTQ